MPGAVGWPVYLYLDAIDEAACNICLDGLYGFDGLIGKGMKEETGLDLFLCVQPDGPACRQQTPVDKHYGLDFFGVVAAEFEDDRSALVLGGAQPERDLPHASLAGRLDHVQVEIGRASWRERV